MYVKLEDNVGVGGEGGRGVEVWPGEAETETIGLAPIFFWGEPRGVEGHGIFD